MLGRTKGIWILTLFNLKVFVIIASSSNVDLVDLVKIKINCHHTQNTCQDSNGVKDLSSNENARGKRVRRSQMTYFFSVNASVLL